MDHFEIYSNYKLTGDQPKVVNELTNSILNGDKYSTLKGVTGSGKTWCMANIIKNVNKPALIISHNKTLAAQLYSEFKELFPNNAVEYFVSHYKYFQPECYLPVQDKYIEKDSLINDTIERMRQHCAQELLSRKDVIVVASVSALFGLGNPKLYYESRLELYTGLIINRDDIIYDLIRKQYSRVESNLVSGTFMVSGDILSIMLSTDIDYYYKIDMFDDEIERIFKVDILTNDVIEEVNSITIFNTSSYMVSNNELSNFNKNVLKELDIVYNDFIKNNKPIFAKRIKERTLYDLEMLNETGWCKGLESYQRYLTDKAPGSAPYSLLDFFPKDYLMFIDESHATIPQIRSIGNQNDSIKENLIKYGFRLPSCVDNRPLNFNEFEEKQNQVIFVSATPGDYEMSKSTIISNQIIRPTGLLDPKIEIRPITGQIDDIYSEINKVIKNKNKVLITVITQKMAEKLAEYLSDMGIKACYLHSGIATIDRVEILNGLQQNKYDVLIGCNLLREGLSISNCELVIILDADKEGFLRNKTSLIQTIGRAARNVNGRAILYADKITKSMKDAIDETNLHRNIQMNYNENHGIIPKSTEIKLISSIIEDKDKFKNNNNAIHINYDNLSKKEIIQLIDKYHDYMLDEASNLNFEKAAIYRDIINNLKINK